ncbi:hypothetical protein QYM36_014874 [Artemia franciscana]|uniref:Glycosyltransferase 2-like domain-containing protein n=1 Tax=Artemia franciscana TaxID=6661 RepID=A0AA88KYQ0_ARTSF|nr:hypothetical protein QYM36_014874 [Artemia franciscana]
MVCFTLYFVENTPIVCVRARSVHTFSMKNPSSDEIPLLSETELELEKCVPSLSSRLKHYIHCACMTLVIFLFLVAGGSISVPYITLVKHIPEFDPIDNYGTWLTLSLYITKCIALLALPQVIFNFMGLLKYRAFPDKPILKSSPILGPFICIRVVTRGDTPNLVRKSVEHNLKTCLKAGLENFIVEVVCDLPVGLPEHRRVRETIVPSRYKPSSGCLFKARALQYCLEDDVNDLADSDWIVHLDEETRLTEDAVKGILNFVTSGEHQFGQGLITYTHITMKNVIITLCDTFRVAEDLGKLRYQFKAWHAPFFGMKGSYVVSQVGAEKLVSFNHGPDGSIAEDCFFSIVAASKGYSFDFIEGEMWEQSPFTVKDFLEQRKRWLQLQENNSDLISSKSAIAAFLRKLQLYKNNIRRRAFEQFPCLACVSSDLQDEDLALYGEYLENIHEDVQTRVGDLLGMDISIWVSIPFEVNVAEIDISLQEPLNEIQSDEIMHAKFKSEKYNIWKTNDVATKYPLLSDKVQFYVIAFPTSYLVEAGFSRVSQMLSKDRNRLDIVKRGDPLDCSLISIAMEKQVASCNFSILMDNNAYIHIECVLSPALSYSYALGKIQNLCNTLGYEFIKTVLGICADTDSSDSILSYMLKGEGWKIISYMLWNKLEGFVCVTELCNVISSLFPICLSKIGPSHSLVNPHLPLVTFGKIETCFQSPKKIRQRQQRIRKSREKERDNSSDSEGTNTKKSNLRIRFDRRDFEYFNRNMKSEDSLSDSENEDMNLSSVAATRGNAVLNEEISAYEMCDILLEASIVAIMNEKQKKVKNYNLPLLCLNFSSSQLLLWEFQNASEGSCNLHIKLLKLFYACCDMLCHNSDIFECVYASGILQKQIDMVFQVTEFLEELNFKDLVVDTVCDRGQPVVIEKLQIFASDYIIGLFLMLEKIINSKYAGGNIRKFVDLVHDIFPRSMDVLERLLKADYMEQNAVSFDRLLKASSNFISALKKYRDNFVHSQLCPKSLHKNCPILSSHHHDIFGQQIRALKLGNANSCVISWCATALLSVFDKCDEKWGGKVLNALRSCGLCCCLETKTVFENVMKKIREAKPEGFGYFRFLLFLARETGLCCDANQTCISCKVNGGLITPIHESEASEKKVSFAERFSFFQSYYDLILESNDSLLLAVLEHLKQFSQEATQGAKQGLILRVILPSLSYFKTLYVNSGKYESILELLLRILAVALNYDIIQSEEIDSHIFNRICDLLLRPQFSKSCARILHLATLLEVKNVDFENSSKPYTELLLAISDFHFTKLIEAFEHEDISIFYYELSGDRLKVGSEDIGYNSDYEKQENKIRVKFGAIPEEDSATESAILPSDRELSEHESQPEQEEAEKKVMRILYVNPDALHLTFVDHLRVAGAVWEALVLSMLYSPRLLEVVRIRPIMKKVLRLVGHLLSHILKNEETDDFGLFESFLVSIQICGPFHVFPATSENPDDITKVLIQCLSSSLEVPVQFTSFLVNSFLSASVLKKFIPHPRLLWNEKRSDFDDYISESLSDNDVCSNSEGYEADTEPCEAYRHAKYEKQIKSSNFEDLNVVFPSLLKYICEIFASQIPRFCKLLDKRIEDRCCNTGEKLNMESFAVGEYDELSSFFQLVVITINRICGFCRKSPLNTELLSKEGLTKIAIASFRPILLNNYKELTGEFDCFVCSKIDGQLIIKIICP